MWRSDDEETSRGMDQNPREGDAARKSWVTSRVFDTLKSDVR